jgi:hypothetical protein
MNAYGRRGAGRPVFTRGGGRVQRCAALPGRRMPGPPPGARPPQGSTRACGRGAHARSATAPGRAPSPCVRRPDCRRCPGAREAPAGHATSGGGGAPGASHARRVAPRRRGESGRLAQLQRPWQHSGLRSEAAPAPPARADCGPLAPRARWRRPSHYKALAPSAPADPCRERDRKGAAAWGVGAHALGAGPARCAPALGACSAPPLRAPPAPSPPP